MACVIWTGNDGIHPMGLWKSALGILSLGRSRGTEGNHSPNSRHLKLCVRSGLSAEVRR
jgi:hypothetical protein